MKTIKEIIKESNIPATLIRAVVRQLGSGKEAIETLHDVARYGASGGFSGFTYYSDTCRFFKRHRAAISALVESMAAKLGESPVAMVRSFNCLKLGVDAESMVGRTLYGGKLNDETTEVENALAWFALEEVARAFYD